LRVASICRISRALATLIALWYSFLHLSEQNRLSGLDPREMGFPHSMQVYDVIVVDVVI